MPGLGEEGFHSQVATFFEYPTISPISAVALPLFSNCRRFFAHVGCGTDLPAAFAQVMRLRLLAPAQPTFRNRRQFDFFATKKAEIVEIVGYSKKVAAL